MQGRRAKLVEEIAEKGICDQRVLEAIGRVKRHLFVLRGMEYNAYENRALSIDDKQTISQPYTVAFQTELLELKANDKVLEIGTGSGYQAAVLCEMGAEVYSVERIKNLHETSTKLLNELCYRAKTFYEDGNVGLENFAPFDKIIITAAATEISKQLLKQLKIGGILVAPVGFSREWQVMKKFIKISENKFEEQSHGSFAFVPMLGGKS